MMQCIIIYGRLVLKYKRKVFISKSRFPQSILFYASLSILYLWPVFYWKIFGQSKSKYQSFFSFSISRLFLVNLHLRPLHLNSHKKILQIQQLNNPGNIKDFKYEWMHYSLRWTPENHLKF